MIRNCCSQNCDVNLSSPLIQPIATLSTSALSIYSSVLASRSPTPPPSACHDRSRGVELSHLQLIPEAHECTHSKYGAQYHRQQQPAVSSVPPPSACTRTPTPRGMLHRCRTGRAADLMNSWLRSKGVSPKRILLVRHARSAQVASTNLSMPTTTPHFPQMTLLRGSNPKFADQIQTL